MTEQTQTENQGEQASPTKQQTKRVATEKWGAGVMSHGYCIVPSLLLRGQRRMNLNATQLAILLQIIDHWWDPKRLAFPGKAELASRLGIGERQVQRHIAELEQEGLVKRVDRYGENGGRQSNYYDLQGLINRLNEIEPDFKEAREESRRRKKQVATRGLRRRGVAGPKPEQSD